MGNRSTSIRLSEKDLNLLRERADRVGMERSEWLRQAIAGWTHTPEKTRELANAIWRATPRRQLPPVRYGAFWWSRKNDEHYQLMQLAKQCGCFLPQFVQILIRHSDEPQYSPTPKLAADDRTILIIPINDFDRVLLQERADAAGLSQARWLRRAMWEWNCHIALGAKYLASQVKIKGAGGKMFRHSCAQVTCSREDYTHFNNLCIAHKVTKAMYARVLIHFAMLHD